MLKRKQFGRSSSGWIFKRVLSYSCRFSLCERTDGAWFGGTGCQRRVDDGSWGAFINSSLGSRRPAVMMDGRLQTVTGEGGYSHPAPLSRNQTNKYFVIAKMSLGTRVERRTERYFVLSKTTTLPKRYNKKTRSNSGADTRNSFLKPSRQRCSANDNRRSSPNYRL
jgi:hypothetical protein